MQRCSNEDVSGLAQFLVIDYPSLKTTPVLVSHVSDDCGNKMENECGTQLHVMSCTESL